VTNKTAALRYARALFDVALREKADFDAIERELASFCALFDEYPALKDALLNPVVPVQRKRATVVALTAQMSAPPMLAKLLALLAERDRLVLLPDLLVGYRERLLDYRKIVRADVTTATPLPAEQAQAIEQRLAAATGRQIAMRTKVDPTIIGGLIAKVGSIVYDASVTRQLERMKQRLEESV